MESLPIIPAKIDAESYVRIVSLSMGLPIPENAIPEVAANFKRATKFAALFAEMPDIEIVESAVVFYAGNKR